MLGPFLGRGLSDKFPLPLGVHKLNRPRTSGPSAFKLSTPMRCPGGRRERRRVVGEPGSQGSKGTWQRKNGFPQNPRWTNLETEIAPEHWWQLEDYNTILKESCNFLGVVFRESNTLNILESRKGKECLSRTILQSLCSLEGLGNFTANHISPNWTQSSAYILSLTFFWVDTSGHFTSYPINLRTTRGKRPDLIWEDPLPSPGPNTTCRLLELLSS